MTAEDNLQRMKTLDDSWNAQGWAVFRKRHSADIAEFWPGEPEPTRGRDAALGRAGSVQAHPVGPRWPPRAATVGGGSDG
jgi:hypothetical protein